MTHDTDTPRRRPDGSIDTAHYVARGRRLRAEAARDMARAVTGAPNAARPARRRLRLFAGA